MFLLWCVRGRLTDALCFRGPNGENLDVNCVHKNEVSGSVFSAVLLYRFFV